MTKIINVPIKGALIYFVNLYIYVNWDMSKYASISNLAKMIGIFKS